ncbi:hypothetical protein [Flavobacterium psychrotolerans]|uniref:N-acetyltransferase domain-containing protein n=1 Tax=Flavobacterium psychrotolerans TaxID=2169410 RepID=A0A2U1JLT1_9FLAO|nr:hypothetical protein [Flavobacterium psychrotolerans]PWA06102.1 hypothetical protein DB895_04150 [Flavobacterium psychrotolerans]
MNTDYLPWIGYAASVIIALSMTMSSIIKFRWINITGAILFSTYGFLIHAFPVGILNGIIVLVDIYYLVNIYSKKETFEILEINAESEYLKRFLSFHNDRIQKILPGFAYNPDMNTVSFFILRNMSVAGLFLAHREDGTVLHVGLDFVLPEYKDFKNGKYVYFKLRQKFIDAGYTSVIAEGNNLNYFKYLKKLGFKEVKKGVYTKEL